MKSVVEKLSPTRVKVEVAVEYGELSPYVDKVLKEAARHVQIPGFRSGKAPARLVEQRVGREYVVGQAVSQGIDDFYRKVLVEQELVVLDAPDVEVKTLPKQVGDSLEFSVEVDVRPEVELPGFDDMELTVSEVMVDDAAAGEALEDLRVRFGTLTTIERAARDEDFVSIDLVAMLAGEKVDEASDLSYQIGSGTMLAGMDEALTGLNAGERKTFVTKLKGGERSGEEADVTVTLKAVKKRELPEVNDEFAQLASEFETVAELKADLQDKAERAARMEQGVEARDTLVQKLLDVIKVDVPEDFIDKQVEQHFEAQDAPSDGAEEPESRERFREKLVEQFKQDTILDVVAKKRDIEVDQPELMEYIAMISGQYGVDPKQFAAMLSQSGQVPAIIADIRRRKAVAAILGDVTVKDDAGNTVDMTEFVGPSADDE